MIDLKLLEGRTLLGPPKQLIGSFSVSPASDYYHEYVIHQAQYRLQARTEEELRAGAKYLSELLVSASRESDLKARKELDQGAERVYITDPISFSALFESQDLLDREDFLDAGPEDYFTLLALIYVLESLAALEQAEHVRMNNDVPDSYSRSLIGHAERFSADRIDEARELIAFIAGIEFAGIFRRKTARKAGKARTRDFGPLKAQILAFVDRECAGLSNKKSARVAVAQFQEAVNEVMKGDEPDHQIAKWIGAHRRGRAKANNS